MQIETRVFHTQGINIKIIWIYLQIIWNNSRLSAYPVPCILHAGYQCQDNLDFIYRLSGIIANYLHIKSRVFHTQGTSVKIIWILQCQRHILVNQWQNCIQSDNISVKRHLYSLTSVSNEHFCQIIAKIAYNLTLPVSNVTLLVHFVKSVSKLHTVWRSQCQTSPCWRVFDKSVQKLHSLTFSM